MSAGRAAAGVQDAASHCETAAAERDLADNNGGDDPVVAVEGGRCGDRGERAGGGRAAVLQLRQQRLPTADAVPVADGLGGQERAQRGLRGNAQ